jgi:hypothetical protein
MAYKSPLSLAPTISSWAVMIEIAGSTQSIKVAGGHGILPGQIDHYIGVDQRNH